MKGLSNSYLLGEVLIFVVFGGMIALSVLMAPTPDVVSLFGFDIPVLCASRKLFGFDCMGCGMTRSFVYMGHFDPAMAFSMNKLGPVLFLLFATQPPYRAYVIIRELIRRRGILGAS